MKYIFLLLITQLTLQGEMLPDHSGNPVAGLLARIEIINGRLSYVLTDWTGVLGKIKISEQARDHILIAIKDVLANDEIKGDKEMLLIYEIKHLQGKNLNFGKSSGYSFFNGKNPTRGKTSTEIFSAIFGKPPKARGKKFIVGFVE